MDSSWKRSFLDKLHKAQAECAKEFEDALTDAVVPVFEDLSAFLRDNGFRVSTPLNEQGRRSFKCELAENAYLLLIFRFSGVGEYELRSETFVPGAEPVLEKSAGNVADIDKDWTQRLFETGLNRFVELLANKPAVETSTEYAAV